MATVQLVKSIYTGADVTSLGEVAAADTPTLPGPLTVTTVLTAASLVGATPTELTISSGAVTATQTIHFIDTESDAASDDLVTINGGADGKLLIFRPIHTDRTVVVKETGNICTGGSDITLNDTSKYILFVYDAALTKWVVIGGTGGGSTGSSSAITKSVNQGTHGFDVGNLVYLSGASTYSKALADAASTAEVVGIVSTDTDADDFVLTMAGHVTGLTGLTAGAVYFLSATSAGALTATEPTTAGYITKPCFIADTTTSGYFFNMRGAVIGGGIVSNTAYDATSWDNVTTIAPSKNAIRDKIESMVPSILIAKTSSGSVSAAELAGNYILTNTGAGDAIALTLPAGVAGYSVEVIVTVAQYLRLTANGTEKFRYGTSEGAAGGYIRDNVIGTHFKITWSGANWDVQLIAGSVSYDQ